MIEGGRVRGLTAAVKDAQSVTSAGEPVQPLIHGVRLRHSTTHADERGNLCEIYDDRWEFTIDAVTYAYLLTLRPGAIRGWSLHTKQDDRLFFTSGTIKVALYDAREESPSVGDVNVLFLGTHDRALLRIPPGVFHAVRNVGTDDAVLMNLPSRPYEHSDPDKYRLPSDSEEIPYRI